MGNDFTENKKYNYENYVSMDINLNKVCFSQGEYIQGTIILQGKPGLIQTELINPVATISLTEMHHYTYEEGGGGDDNTRQVDEEEEKTIFSLQQNYQNFQGKNIMSGIQIPFNVQIPNAHPTCIFNSNTYVKHILSIEFLSIQAKKSTPIVVKNSQHFRYDNKLLQTPAIVTKEMEKHKVFFNQGKFAAVLKLPKNSFAYEENIPFELTINCTQLDLKIKNIIVTLHRVEKQNFKSNNERVRFSGSKEIVNKVIPVQKGIPQYVINDFIQFPTMSSYISVNPIQVYKTLDNDKNNLLKNLNKIHLAPSCYDGLLSVDYYLKVLLEFSSKLTTDESLKIPLEFYEPFDINSQKQGNNNINNNQIKQNFNQNNNNYQNNMIQNNPYQINMIQNNQNNQILNNQERSYVDNGGIYGNQRSHSSNNISSIFSSMLSNPNYSNYSNLNSQNNLFYGNQQYNNLYGYNQGMQQYQFNNFR